MLSELLLETARWHVEDLAAPPPGVTIHLLERSAAVCAAVEAFQAAPREYDAACNLIDDDDRATRDRATAAFDAVRSVEARLLEVDLG